MPLTVVIAVQKSSHNEASKQNQQLVHVNTRSARNASPGWSPKASPSHELPTLGDTTAVAVPEHYYNLSKATHDPPD